jgi:hypothetical protein
VLAGNDRPVRSLLLDECLVLDDAAFVEAVVWQLDRPLAGCARHFKYRLACVVRGSCLAHCDNEAGMGDHRHVGARKRAYRFTSVDALQLDFCADAARWKEQP